MPDVAAASRATALSLFCCQMKKSPRKTKFKVARELPHGWLPTPIPWENLEAQNLDFRLIDNTCLGTNLNGAGTFASWHLTGALAESDYLMRDSTDSGMSNRARRYVYDRFHAAWDASASASL
jgi:hypothetical protein